MKEKIEFIESYIKRGNDYEWSDNHGELIRCKCCKYRKYCEIQWNVDGDFFCANGERKEDNSDGKVY